VPELPDLEVIAAVLRRRIAGIAITAVDVRRPIVVRNLTGCGFTDGLVGQAIVSVSRRGKFLLLELSSDGWLVINPMLHGKLRLRQAGERVTGKPFVVLGFADGQTLCYYDSVTMGKVYLTPSLDWVPRFAEQGPEALDPALTLEAFSERLRKRRGEIKGVLTNQAFMAGIGNAYVDEILFHAGVYPFRKSPSLTPDEVQRVYEAMNAVLREAMPVLQERIGEDIHIKLRDFLKVHGHGGEPCPRCGTPISEIRARRRLTNFCRTCQPGLMVGR